MGYTSGMKTASENLLDLLKDEYPNWLASGNIERMEIKNRDGTLATPRSLVRRLEELREEGKLLVEYRGKNHAFYQYNKETEPVKPLIGYVTTPEGRMPVYGN